MNPEEIINPKARVFVDEENCEICIDGLGIQGFEEYVELMYDKVIGIAIDPIESRTLIDMVIVNPRNGIAMLVKEGSEVVLIEAKGKKVHALVSEGDKVSVSQRVFYIVTGKYEVRVIRSPVEGIVVYIGEIVPSIPQRFVMVIVREELVRKLRFSNRCRVR